MEDHPMAFESARSMATRRTFYARPIDGHCGIEQMALIDGLFAFKPDDTCMHQPSKAKWQQENTQDEEERVSGKICFHFSSPWMFPDPALADCRSFWPRRQASATQVMTIAIANPNHCAA